MKTENPQAVRTLNHPTWLAAAAAIAVVFLGITLLAFIKPADKPSRHTIAYTQKVSFGYHASARRGPVYPSGVVATGDPIFLQLVHQLGVHVAYRLTSARPLVLHGTDQVVLKLTGPTGWSRSTPLTATRHFTGDHVSAQVSLNLPRLQALLNQIQRQTGVPASGYTIAVTANVHVRGSLAGHPVATSVSPALTFELEPLQLQLQPTASASTSGSSSTSSSSTTSGSSTTSSSSSTSGGTQPVFSTTQSGSVATSAVTGNTLSLSGLSLRVRTMRLVAPTGFLLALAVTLILLVLEARSPAFGESARIQSRYGHRMVPITTGADLGWPAVDVTSMKALARLAEISSQLILHHHGEETDSYLVNDDGTVYRYQAQLPKVVWGEWSEPVVPLAGSDLAATATALEAATLPPSDLAAAATALEAAALAPSDVSA